MESSEVYILKSFVFVHSELDGACSMCLRDENLGGMKRKGDKDLVVNGSKLIRTDSGT
jgi:hypothetical protein